MIPARPGTTAVVAEGLVAVEAWDDEGHALVVDSVAGRLVRADTLDGFERVYDADLIAVIPGGGWLARFEKDPNLLGSTSYTTPVVAWGLMANGFLEAFVYQGEEGVMQVDVIGQRVTVGHPDEHLPWRTG